MTRPMNGTDLLERLAKAATPGPWHRDRLEPETVRTEAEGDIVIYETQHIRDAAFVEAANPAAVLALIEQVRRLEEALVEIADQGSPFDKTGEPLHVRISKDLSRRIDIAQAALQPPISNEAGEP